jgi:predicted PurR-regulated permease PerM
MGSTHPSRIEGALPLSPPEQLTPPESLSPPETDANPLQAVDPAARRRPPIHLMSPFRIGFTATIGALVAYGLAQALIQARSVLILLVVAMFIALGLNPMVEFLMRRGLKRALAIVVVFAGVLALLGLAGFAVVPVFSEQISTLVTSAPSILQDLLQNPQIRAFNDRFQLITKAQQFLTSGSLVQQVFGGLLGAGKVVLGAVFSGFTLLILTLYFLATLPSIKNAIYKMAPASRRDRVRSLAEGIFQRISAYLSGMFMVVTTAGVFSFVFLLIVGLREYALALAVVVAILDFIPMVGATIAAVIVCIVAFVHSPGAGIAAVIFYVLYQQFENYVVQPRVMKKAVDVPGAVVVIAALLGGTLLGVVGALLAVPTAAALLLLLREVAQPRLDAS